MTDDLLTRAYRLFDAAMDRPEGERRSYILAQAGPNEELAAEAFSLLEVHDEGPIELPQGLTVPQPLDRTGSVIDDWRIEKFLGEGGFGKVYRASRPIPGGDEEAAIKFLDNSPTSVARFQQERQLLADLNHEGIAHFIGGGTDGEIPYVIMEYISGVPITEYCLRRNLDFWLRIELFIRLCRIVEYAHSHRVLHRDLKPGNVLISAAGAVRVLDFGIARLLDTSAAERLTKTPEPLWSRPYASPEQLAGGDLSFATDLYSLGVILYELVTGRRPFSNFALSGSDWMQIVCERDPVAPSDAVMLEDPERGPAATQEPTSSRRLRRILRGDLDAIIMKALKKDPRDRYHRVDRLRLELEKHRNGFAVEARASSFVERVHKWIGKNRMSAAAIMLSTLWAIGVLHVSVLHSVDFDTQEKNEEMVVHRLRYLAEAALPNLELMVEQTPDSTHARQTLVQIHTDFLHRLDSLPSLTSNYIDHALIRSATQCARQWLELGEAQKALDTINPAVTRAGLRYKVIKSEAWGKLYREALRQRIAIDVSLNKNPSEDVWLLAGAEKRSN